MFLACGRFVASVSWSGLFSVRDWATSEIVFSQSYSDGQLTELSTTADRSLFVSPAFTYGAYVVHRSSATLANPQQDSRPQSGRRFGVCKSARHAGFSRLFTEHLQTRLRFTTLLVRALLAAVTGAGDLDAPLPGRLMRRSLSSMATIISACMTFRS